MTTLELIARLRNLIEYDLVETRRAGLEVLCGDLTKSTLRDRVGQ